MNTVFDIREYYNTPHNRHETTGYSVSEIDEDIHEDIDNLLNHRFDRLYKSDTYKYGSRGITIIYPAINYPGSRSIMMGPDRARSLLSVYPERSDLPKISRIVLRPRFIDIGSVELVALYLRKSRTLVYYLFHPHYYSMLNAGQAFTSSAGSCAPGPASPGFQASTDSGDNEFRIHPLWYIISHVNDTGPDVIEKFFIKKEFFNSKTGEILNDISFYYSRHGY